MHTKQMQQDYPSIYESFFTQQKIIYSTPFVASRTGEADALYNGISIKQKIPLRMYIGINTTATPGFHFGNITYRDFTENTFLTTTLRECTPYSTDIEKYIHALLQTHDPKRNTRAQGYVCTILSELPRGVGLGFDSIFSLLVATALYRLDVLPFLHEHNTSQEVSPLLTSSVVSDDISEDINNHNTPLYHIVRLAHTIESHIKGYHYVNGTIATSMSNSSFPIITYHEDLQHSGEKELLWMNDYRCFAYPLHIMYPDIGETAYNPIDYGILYSGRPTLHEHNTGKAAQKESACILDAGYEVTKQSVAQINAQKKPKFFKEIINPHIKGVSHLLHATVGYMSFEIVHYFKTVYKKGYTEEDIKKLLGSLTKMRYAQNIVKNASMHFLTLVTAIQQNFGYRSDLLGLTYNDTSMMGGCLLFATPLEGLRRTLVNSVHQTQREFPGVDMIYASRQDGISDTGLVCEQDLLQQKGSQYIDSTMLVLETTDKKMLFGSYNDLIHSKDVDIILDTVQMKIYTQGRKLTSKDLHSQTGTIDMLMATLKNLGTDISNKQLPLSSYSKSKNDMVGKIIIPFTKLVKNELKKDLPLECYGGMYEYFLRLNKHSIKFGIMRKAVEIA